MKNVYYETPLKSIARKVLLKFGINFRASALPGISAFGVNFYVDRKRIKHRSQYALDFCLKKVPQSVLDVGSGENIHANAFANSGANVTCIDYGTSVYAQKSEVNSAIRLITCDFLKLDLKEKFELVWCSHTLEHVPNVGIFIQKLIEFCRDDGCICITVPDLHRKLYSGHLTLWTPGLLAYNVVLQGLDLSEACFVKGTNEFSLIFRPVKANLPDNLTFDFGDLTLLQHLLPAEIGENVDPWKVEYK